MRNPEPVSRPSLPWPAPGSCFSYMSIQPRKRPWRQRSSSHHQPLPSSQPLQSRGRILEGHLRAAGHRRRDRLPCAPAPFQKPSGIRPRKCLILRHRDRPVLPFQKQVILEGQSSAGESVLVQVGYFLSSRNFPIGGDPAHAKLPHWRQHIHQQTREVYPAQTMAEDEKVDPGVIVVILVALPLIIYPFFAGRTELLIGVSFSTAMNVLAIAKCWDLKRFLWFWVVISLIMALHFSLAFFVHWPRVTMTRLTLLPIGLMYYGVTVGLARFIERFAVKAHSPKLEE